MNATVRARFAASRSPRTPAQRDARPRISRIATTVSLAACARANGNQLGATIETRISCKPGIGFALAVASMSGCIHPTPCHFWLAKYSQNSPTTTRNRLGQASLITRQRLLEDAQHGVGGELKRSGGRPHVHPVEPVLDRALED